jgi:folate-dependent phosphoribosylglycinamide formyltransferase PurN
MSRPWIVFFSQTGSEIANISEQLGREPDLIITNKDPNKCEDVDERIDRLYHLSRKPSLEEYENVLDAFENPIITLHGYLRILPKEICEKYEIYNGHPGLITKYPELKGKDPQVRAWEGKYSTIGAVLHRVTAGVDEGPIHSWTEKSVNEFSLNETFRILREVSLGMWVNFLKKVL